MLEQDVAERLQRGEFDQLDLMLEQDLAAKVCLVLAGLQGVCAAQCESFHVPESAPVLPWIRFDVTDC